LPLTPSDEEAFERVRIGLDAIRTFGKLSRSARLSRERLGWLVGRTAPLLARQQDIDIAMIMYDQIVRDARCSDLNHAKSLEVAAARSRNLLLPVIDRRDGSRLWDSTTLNISPTSWQGVFDANSFSAVSRLADVLGRPLTINVSAIDVAACAAAFIMKFRGLPITLVTNDASGREQALRLAKGDLSDFVIAADAPMFMTPGQPVAQFVKRMDLYRQSQALLKRVKGELAASRTLFLYPCSSAQQQFKLLTMLKDRGLQLDPTTQIYELEMADYANLALFMKRDDLVFAWDPLLSRLLRRGDFIKDRGTDFELSIALFERDDWRSGIQLAGGEALIDCFVAAWTSVRRDPLAAWAASLHINGMVEGLGRGAGFA
jgi:hypothetical protein